MLTRVIAYLLITISTTALASFPQLEKQAKAGDLQAQLQLAQKYEDDASSAKPTLPEATAIQQAKHWYQQAAQANSRTAHFRLGSIHEGYDSDAPAIKHYTIAADQGHVMAQTFLAGIYRHSPSSKNLPLALKYYQMAATNPELPYFHASYMAAEMHHKALGTKQDLPTALAYYQWGISLHRFPPKQFTDRAKELQSTLNAEQTAQAQATLTKLKTQHHNQRKQIPLFLDSKGNLFLRGSLTSDPQTTQLIKNILKDTPDNQPSLTIHPKCTIDHLAKASETIKALGLPENLYTKVQPQP